jgi:hypothetical protein
VEIAHTRADVAVGVGLAPVSWSLCGRIGTLYYVISLVILSHDMSRITLFVFSSSRRIMSVYYVVMYCHTRLLSCIVTPHTILYRTALLH